MAQPTVLETIIDGLKPKKKRLITKKNVVHVLGIASRLLAFAVVKQPALIPVHGLLEELLKPAPINNGADAEDAELHAKRVLRRIAALKTKMTTTNDIEQRKIKEQIDALYDLLTEE